MIEIVVHGSNSIVLAGLVSTLNQQQNFIVVSSFDRTSLISAIEHQPDLLILERSPDEDWWLDPTSLPLDCDLFIILLTDSLTTEELDEYLELGFKGFLPRLISASEIIAAINAVIVGLIVIHPEFESSINNNSAITPLPPSEIYLTSREIEVLRLVADGLDNKAIALQLQISKHTVKFHISSILSKLDVSSRTEAVTFGLRQGFILL